MYIFPLKAPAAPPRADRGDARRVASAGESRLCRPPEGVPGIIYVGTRAYNVKPGDPEVLGWTMFS